MLYAVLKHRINPDYEYLEEVRFELFSTIALERQGLLNYLEEVAAHLYNTVPIYANKPETRGIIRNETQLPLFRSREEMSETDFYRDRWKYWANYFPSYTVSGIAVKGVAAVLYSPYEDEIHPMDGYVLKRTKNTTTTGRPKIKVIRRFDN